MKRLYSCILLVMGALWVLLGAGDVWAQPQQGRLQAAVLEAQRAGVAETTINSVVTMGYERQLKPDETAALLQVMTAARRENVPLQPFLSKMEEGLAKNVPASRIEQVLTSKLDDYRFAHSLARNRARAGDPQDPIVDAYLVRLTETLYCGLSRHDLDALAKQANDRPLAELTRAAEAMAAMKQMQFEPAVAGQIAATGLRQNYFAQERPDFTRAVAAAKAKGVSSQDITQAAMKTMEKMESPNQFRARLGVTDEDVRGFGPRQERNQAQAGQGLTGKGMPGGQGAGSGSGQGSGIGGSGSSGHGGSEGGSGGGGPGDAGGGSGSDGGSGEGSGGGSGGSGGTGGGEGPGGGGGSGGGAGGAGGSGGSEGGGGSGGSDGGSGGGSGGSGGGSSR